METLEFLLKDHPFLQGFDEEQIRFMTGCAANLHFKPGEYVIQEGAPSDRLYLIRSGRVSLEIHLPGQGAVQVETVGAGDVLGLSWMFPPSTWHLDGRAVEPVRAFAFDAACLRNKMEADHDLGFALYKRLIALTFKRLERVRMQRLDLYKAETSR